MEQPTAGATSRQGSTDAVPSEVSTPPARSGVPSTRAATACLVLGIAATLLMVVLLIVVEIDSSRPGSMGFSSEPTMIAFAGFIILGWPLMVIATAITGVIGLRSRRGVVRSIVGIALSCLPGLIPLAMLLGLRP